MEISLGNLQGDIYPLRSLGAKTLISYQTVGLTEFAL